MLQADIARLAGDFIKFHPLGVLATVNTNGVPWTAAVYVASDDEFNLYFTTKAHTKKQANIAQNPAVSLVIVNEQKQATLQAQGEAKRITDPKEANVASTVLRRVTTDSEDWMPPIAKLDAGEYELYKIKVTYAALRVFGDRRKDEMPQEWEYSADTST